MSEDTEEVKQEASPQEAQPDDTEAHARRLGWVSKEEFKGDPERWRPAAEFVKLGEEHIGVARENNRKLQDQLDRISSELSEVKRASGEFREFASKAEERAYKRAREEVEGQMRRAVENADTQAFDSAKQQLATLDTEYRPAAPPAPQQPQISPEVTRWVNENAWYDSDPELKVVATMIHGRILRDKPFLSLTDNLAEVKAEISRRYPERFGNLRRDAASSVSTPSAPNGQGRKSNGRSYDDLPSEAKKACDRFVKMIPGYKREEYLAQYDWSAQ